MDELPLALRAAGALLQYVRDTQRSALPHIAALKVEDRSDALVLDAATRRNLELELSLTGNEAATLFAVIDSTVTAMGSRALRRALARPLRTHAALRRQYQAIATLNESRAFEAVRECLRPIGDVERILARVALRSARPRDLVQLRNSLAALPALRATLTAFDSPRLAELHAGIGEHAGEHALLQSAVDPEPAQILRDGGVIAPGHDAELDRLRTDRRQHRRLPGRTRAARAQPHRHRQPQTGLQPRPGFLHRGDACTRRARACRLRAPPDRQVG